MPLCDIYNRCPIFKTLDGMPVLETYQRQFCQANCDACARQMVHKALGDHEVPLGLLPDQWDLAERIINEKKTGPGREP